MGELAALANAVIWALTGIVLKGVGKNVRSSHIVTSQALIGLAFLLVVSLVIGQIDDLAHLQLRSVLFLAGGALINTAGSLVFWLALSRTTVSSVYPTTQSIFIVVSMVSGWLFLDDSPQVGVIGGAALIIGGVILLNWRVKDDSPGATGRGHYAGILLPAVAAVLWAGGFLSTVVGLEETPPVAAATIRNLVPAILFVAVSILFPSTRITRVFRGNGIRLTVGAVLFAISALTFVLALAKASPGVVVVLINTSPMFAVILAVVILRERLSRFAIVGTALSMAGIFIVLGFR